MELGLNLWVRSQTPNFGQKLFRTQRSWSRCPDTDGLYFFTKGLELASLDEAYERFHELRVAAEIRQVERNLLPIHRRRFRSASRMVNLEAVAWS